MFHREGASTTGGGGEGKSAKTKQKKDAPLRKSDRRRLRDRFLDLYCPQLSKKTVNDQADDDGGEADTYSSSVRTLLDDAFACGSCHGDVLARKVKLKNVGSVTLYLRTASSSSSPRDSESSSTSKPLSAWPYRSNGQAILVEMEDDRRSVRSVPLLPLLAVLAQEQPPPATATTETETPTTQLPMPPPLLDLPVVDVHPATTKFLCRGADLMRSGIARLPPPSTSATESWTRTGGVVAVRAVGNPQIFAVGFVTSGTDPSTVGAGAKGIGVQIVSCYGDDLWREQHREVKGGRGKGGSGSEGVASVYGGRFDDGHYGNVGFVDGARVLGLVRAEENVAGEQEVIKGAVDAERAGQESGESSSVEAPAANDGGGGDAQDAATGCPSVTDVGDAADEAKDGEGNRGGYATAAATQEQAPPPLPQSQVEPDHDDILLRAFHTSLLSIPPSSLPLPVSTYNARHLLPSVPSNGPPLNLKRTRHKKIGPFLLEQAARGVLSIKASSDGKDKCAFVTQVNKGHIDLRDARREKRERGDDGEGRGNGASTKLPVVTLHVVPRRVADALRLDPDAVSASDAKSPERRGTGFLTKPECRSLLDQYVAENNLVDPFDPETVRLDGPLCDALYKPTKKQQQQNGEDGRFAYPTEATRKDLHARWVSVMDDAFAVVEMPGNAIRSLKRGKPPTVDVEVECRQNRKKFVTRVRGLEEYGIDGADFANEVARRFACAATVESNPEGRAALKRGRVEAVFQGHLADELRALLTGDERMASHGGARGGEYRLPKGVIDVKLRKGVPARKRC